MISHTPFKTLPAFLILLCFRLVASAQTMKIVTQGQDQQASARGLVYFSPEEVQQRREKYAEAYKDFQNHNDRALMDDITGHPEKGIELKQRIQSQRDRTQKMLEAQGRYYEAVQSQFRQIYDSMARPVGGVSYDEDKKHLQDMADQFFEQRQRLVDEETLENSLLVRGQYDEEIKDLRDYEDSLKGEQLVLEKQKENDAGYAEARRQWLQSQQKVLALWDTLTKDSQVRIEARDKMYDSYSSLVGRVPTTQTSVATEPVLPPISKVPKPVSAGAAQVASDKVGGVSVANGGVKPKATPTGSLNPPSGEAKTGTGRIPVTPINHASVPIGGIWKGAQGSTRITLTIHEDGENVSGTLQASAIKFQGLPSNVAPPFSGKKHYNTDTNSYTFLLNGEAGQIEIVAPGPAAFGLVWTKNGKSIFDGAMSREGAPGR
jgi:hypothetical protein